MAVNTSAVRRNLSDIVESVNLPVMAYEGLADWMHDSHQDRGERQVGAGGEEYLLKPQENKLQLYGKWDEAEARKFAQSLGYDVGAFTPGARDSYFTLNAPAGWVGGEAGAGGWQGLQNSGLNLQPYTKNTAVQLSPYERNILDIANQLVTGEYGNYRQLLSGRPDFGQLYAGVIEPARRELQQNVLPQIADIYGQSPLGAGYNTGARKEAQAEALRGFADQTAGLRYGATEQAKQNAFQAMGQLTNFENIQMIDRLNEIANIERDIGVHYRNQGLSVEEFNADMAFTNAMMAGEQFEASMGMEQEKLNLQREMFDYQIQQAQEAQRQQESAGMFGSLGSLLGLAGGAALGSALPGVGTMMGASLGSSLGSGLGLLASGGAPTAGYQTLSGIMPQIQYQSMLSSLMGGGIGNRSSVLSSTPQSSLAYYLGGYDNQQGLLGMEGLTGQPYYF